MSPGAMQTPRPEIHIFLRYAGENAGGLPQTFNNACKYRHFEI
jgi:hypothetical protein